jgi:hypothetical protein
VKDLEKIKIEFFFTASAFGMPADKIEKQWAEYEQRGYS